MISLLIEDRFRSLGMNIRRKIQMLFLDYTQVQHCKLRGEDKLVLGIIYNDSIFVKAKAFPKEELEVAIKECREEYLDHEERSKVPTLLVKGKNSVGIWMQNQHFKQEDVVEILESDKLSASASSNTKSASSRGNSNRLDVRKLGNKMRTEAGVEIKTRRHKLKLYQRCFLGNEAVDWIVEQTKVSRPAAIKIGQIMLEKGIFNHVLNESQFKDENILYRFKEDEGKSLLNSNI